MTQGKSEKILHILTLSGIAFAQPLYELLGKNAEFFSVRNNGVLDISLLVLFLSICIPIILIIVDRIICMISKKYEGIVHRTIIAALIILCTLPILKSASGLSSTLVISGSFCISLTITYYYRNDNLRLFITYLSPSILIFPLLFLFNSDVRYLLFKPEPPAIEIPEINATSPIVMIIFDELPLSTIITENKVVDSVLFPGFSKLANHSTWYPNTTAVAEFTTRAIPALLTGNLPLKSEKEKIAKQSFSEWVGIPAYEHHPKNIFTALSKQYELRIFETASNLCPKTLCPIDQDNHAFSMLRFSTLLKDLSVVYQHLIFPSQLEKNLPRIDMGWSDFAMSSSYRDSIMEDDTAIFYEFIDSLTPSKKPTFYFHHSTLPHSPWIHLPSDRLYGSVKLDNLGASLFWDKYSNNELSYKRHLLQSMYADKLLLKALEELHKNDIYHKALIIVTTDHGASFLPGSGFRTVSEENYADILNVPLFIKMPGQTKPKIDERHLLSIDIFPVLFDKLDQPTPWPMDGKTITNRNNQTQEEIFYIDRNGDRKKIAYSPESKYETVRKKINLFGEMNINGIYGGAEYADLIGHKPQDIICKRSINDDVTVKNIEEFSNINLHTGIVPALVNLLVPKDTLTKDEVLAIAINEKIASVTPMRITSNIENKFRVIVNDQFFSSGKNILNLYAIDMGNNCK